MLSQLGALRRSCCEKERGDNGRFANKGDGTGNRPLDNDAVESRFHSVLPNLLEGYLVPFKGISLVAW
jgi:hypothetical protein